MFLLFDEVDAVLGVDTDIGKFINFSSAGSRNNSPEEL